MRAIELAALALYRKYRPLKLNQVIGQEHITKTLANSLKQGTVSHAYLFTGPHGVGKTSVARILAHEANGLKYDEKSHLDIIEIDAASNRRIDEIRDLRDKIHIAPTVAKYKVYIIDEVHMLTKEAFNALLKTLEEPPEHALFILATTDSHKLPETIVSRTQRFTFRPVPIETLAAHLADLAKSEAIKIDSESIELLAAHAGGSVRDAVALLEQMDRTEGPISPQTVRHHLGLAPQAVLDKLSAAITANELAAIVEALNDAKTRGISPTVLSIQLIEQLRGEPSVNNLDLIEKLLTVPGSNHPAILLETIVLKSAAASPAMSVKPISPPEPTPAELPPEATATQAEISSSPPVITSSINDKQWRALLKEVKSENNSLYAILRMAQPVMVPEEKALHLNFRFPFHQKRISEERNKRQTEKYAKKVFGSSIRIVVKHNPETEQAPGVFVRSGVGPEVEGVIDVMGGGEVVDL